VVGERHSGVLAVEAMASRAEMRKSYAAVLDAFG
jgi:hypothetical protein